MTDNGGVRLQANTTGPAYKSDSLTMNYRLTVGALKSDDTHDKPIEFEDQKFVGGALAFYFGNSSSLIANAYYFVNNDYLYLEDFLDITAPRDAFTGLTGARLNRYSTARFVAGRKKDAFWDLPAANANLTFLSRLTENGNLRMAYYFGWSDDRRRNVRGSTVLANNYVINRQDVRNNNGIENHSFQLDYLHKWTTKAFTLNTTAGADGSLNQTWFHQSVTVMPALDTRQTGFPDDDAYFARFPTDDSYFITPRPASVGGPATRTEQRATSVSYYFQENLSFLKDRLILVGGLRWYRPSQLDTNLVTNTITDGNLNRFRVHKYGAVVKVLPGVSLYWTDAENVFPPAPGNTDKFLQGDQQGERYRPSVGKLREFGAKFEWRPSERISVYGTIARYDMAQTNIRTQGVLPNGLIGNIQSAQDESDGLELGVRAKFGPGRADLIVTGADGDSAIAADKGKAYVQQANGFAQQKGSALAKYTWTSGPLRGLMLGAGVEKESLRRNVTYKLYHPPIVDAFAGYSWGPHWSTQLNLSNVTDKRYIVQVFNQALVQTSDTFRSSLTLRYKY
ncbi:MAG: TonB-dependent receptor [Opitutus sp.]|nr:TonB-dependent receptor [Opitutus sp.]